MEVVAGGRPPFLFLLCVIIGITYAPPLDGQPWKVRRRIWLDGRVVHLARESLLMMGSLLLLSCLPVNVTSLESFRVLFFDG